MALRIQVLITLNLGDGSYDCEAYFRDTVTGRSNTLVTNIPDPGGTTSAARTAILTQLVSMCNHDNTVGGASTTNATISDIIPNG